MSCSLKKSAQWWPASWGIPQWWPVSWWPQGEIEATAKIDVYILPSVAECVRDQIALFVYTELVNQKAIADDLILNHPLAPESIQAAEDISNGVFDVLDNFFIEKATIFQTAQMPGINVIYGNSSLPVSGGNNISRQTSDSIYSISVHIEGRHEQDGAVIKYGDEKSAKLAARIIQIMRGIIMSGQYVRLGFDEKPYIIGKRWVPQVDVLQPDFQQQDARNGIVAVLSINVNFEELAPDVEGVLLLSLATAIKLKLKTEDNGKIINIDS